MLALWWQQFQDPQLNHLIQLALQNNLDIQAAGARIAQARAQRQPRMQGPARLDQQLAAPCQVDAVVGVPPVSRAAPGGDQPAAPELTEVVGDQALWLAEQVGELADLPVAAGQFGQQPPAQRMPGQPEEPGRSALHTDHNRSNQID